VDQATLVRDLNELEMMAVRCHYGTNCFIHIARIRELAENGFYHLKRDERKSNKGKALVEER
jgi:arginine repressor